MSPHCMQTNSGRLVNLASMSEEDIDIGDIAHSLAHIVRFTGHISKPYSVAQHCMLVADLCPPEHRLWGLLHDASEAYLGDVATPLKSMMPGYRGLEEHVQRVIARVFRLTWPMPSDVKDADLRALMAEKRDLITCDHDWGIEVEPHCGPVNPYCWSQAKELFEKRYLELVKP